MAKHNDFGCENVRVCDLMTLTEAGEFLGLSAMTVWGWVESKLIRSVKIGTATVIDINDAIEVNDMMKRRKNSIAGRSKSRSAIAVD